MYVNIIGHSHLGLFNISTLSRLPRKVHVFWGSYIMNFNLVEKKENWAKVWSNLKYFRPSNNSLISQACLRQRWENIGPWSFFYPSRLCFYYQNLAPILLQDGRYVCLARYSYGLCTIQTMGTEYTHTNLHASFETCSNCEKSCTKTSLTNLLLLSH